MPYFFAGKVVGPRENAGGGGFVMGEECPAGVLARTENLFLPRDLPGAVSA